MRRSALLGLALAPVAAMAQNATFLAGLVGALQGQGLTQLIKVAQSVGGTTTGQELLANITSGGPYLLFAPNDAAWSKAPSNFTSSNETLADVFSYHVVPGNFSGIQTQYPNVTLGRTLYDNPDTVRLEGNKSQAVAWAVRDDNRTHVLNQKNDSTVVNTTTFGNLTIYIIDSVLQVPENLVDTIPTNNGSFTAFETVLRSATTSFYNSTTNQTSDVSLFNVFNDGYRGFTLFAPNNSAIAAANSTLQGLASNTTALNNVILNHIINGTSLYSPLLAGTDNFTSAAGETFSFSLNETGHYVTLGNMTAQIVQPDILLPNGVIHVIDNVFASTESNADAASSALSSVASSATASQASQTPPIGFSQTQGLAAPTSGAGATGNGGGNGGNGGSGSSSGNGASALGSAKTYLGYAMAAVGVVFGGAMTLF